ncbi:MAG: rhamnogalacturonan acetylesterase, partial [Planctomycetaceae bacterium]|nr:rhamnogalacturonan acetylesterase [Planctomycetaceae bacterium]
MIRLAFRLFTLAVLTSLTMRSIADDVVTETTERVVLVGDSTVATNSGWGDSFGSMLKSNVKWSNWAKGGRSSKSFREEGWWDKALAEQPTWVFIQFGHNDQPGKGPQRETDPRTTFRENLIRYVQESRDAGAHPVLVSSLTRRFFGDAGTIDASVGAQANIPEGFRLPDYAAATAAVAKEFDVPLVDLHDLSVAEMNRLGPESAARFEPPAKDPSAPDKTHLNEYGAAATAQLVADAICESAPEFGALLQSRRTYRFHFGNANDRDERTLVTTTTEYTAERDYGFVPGVGNESVRLFNVDLPEGNYAVTVRLGAEDHPTETTIKTEARRLMLEQVVTAPDEFVTRTFTVNVRRPGINGTDYATKLNSRELGLPLHPSWDDHLTFEFNGKRPGVVAIDIRPCRPAVTVFIAGDSTVTDQRNEPYAGWGQMLPRWFAEDVAVSNHAESGLALRSFESQRRLEKLLSMLQPGDYVLVQFGHNDQKDNRDGAGPFTTYKADLIRFVEAVRGRQGRPVLITSMERLRMDANGNQTPTLAEYAEAVRQVGQQQTVPVIDLNAMSLQFYGALGPNRSTKAFACYPANTFPGQTERLKDQTHHNAYGAYELARCVICGIRDHVPELAKHLATDTGNFDPAS